MSDEATNYARNRKTRELMFWGSEMPSSVRQSPDEWASWHPTSIEMMHRIGEGVDEHCERNHHRPRRCMTCRITEKQAVRS